MLFDTVLAQDPRRDWINTVVIMSKGKFMDVLQDLSSSSSSDEDVHTHEDDAKTKAPAARQPAGDTSYSVPIIGVTGGASDWLHEQQQVAAVAVGSHSKRVRLTVEDLQRAGYKEGPSVLFMKPPAEEQQNSWNWGNGKAAKELEPQDETYAERQATHHAAGAGTAESAMYSQRMSAHAQKLREDARLEKEALARDKRLTFNQKEKRKRDTGQATKAKTYVEEEKRLGRAHGMYSGFD